MPTSRDSLKERLARCRQIKISVIGRKSGRTIICDGKLSVKRLKKSRATLHALRTDHDVLFDESPLLKLAKANPDTELFPWSRQYMDVVIKRYSTLAGIHPAKRHYHVLKHSICVLLWQETHDLNAIQDHVGHRSSSSTLVYLRADAAEKAQNTIAGMSFSEVAIPVSRLLGVRFRAKECDRALNGKTNTWRYREIWQAQCHSSAGQPCIPTNVAATSRLPAT
jgi:hypothetical protein